MSIGKALLNKDTLHMVKHESWKVGRAKFIDLGMQYYDQHPDDVQEVADNLAYMGFGNSGAALDEVLRELAVHYYEKLFVLVKMYEGYWMIKNRVELGDSLRVFQEAKAAGKPVFIGQSHFGATYFLNLVLMIHGGFDVKAVAKLPDPVGLMLQERSDELCRRFGTGEVKVVNLAYENVNVPMTMIMALKNKEFISNVFDENNALCKPRTLMGKMVMGGTGMDQVLKPFNDDQVTIVTPFLIRTSEDTFRYEVDQHFLAEGDVIDSFYRSLEQRLHHYHPQWYFIHELAESIEPIEAPKPKFANA